MDEYRLENAFSGVPPMVHARVLTTLQEVKTVKKAKPAAALILAAILILALAGAAYAAVQSGVLDFVFQRSEPTGEQRGMVQTVGLTHEAKGVVTTVTDAILDGRNLSVGLRFDTDKDFYIVTESVTVNGAELFINDSNIANMWLRWPLEEKRDTVSRGFTGTLDAEYYKDEAQGAKETAEAAVRRLTKEGIAEVRMRLVLLTPKNELEYVYAYDDRSAAAWRAINACVEAGNTPVDQESGYVWVDGTWLTEDNPEMRAGLTQKEDGGYSWTDGEAFSPDIPAAQFPIGDAQAHVRHSNMEVLDSFTFSFTLNVDGSGFHDVTPSGDVENDDFRVVFDEASLTPASSTFAFRIFPKKMPLEEIARIFRFIAFYDENKRPILFQDTFYEGDAGLEEQADGASALAVRYRMPAMESRPDVIYLAPYNEESGAGQPLWDYAIPVDCLSGGAAK